MVVECHCKINIIIVCYVNYNLLFVKFCKGNIFQRDITYRKDVLSRSLCYKYKFAFKTPHKLNSKPKLFNHFCSVMYIAKIDKSMRVEAMTGKTILVFRKHTLNQH